MESLNESCSLLEAVWRWWGDSLAALGEDGDAWARPTRLAGWDVAALVAHHALFVGALGMLASSPVDGPPVVSSAVDMLRRFNEPAGLASTAAGAVAEIARQQAASLPPAQLAAAFSVGGPDALASVRAAGPIVVDYFGNGPFPLEEAVRIGMLEGVVHGLDLCDAVGSDPRSLPADPVDAVVGMLASMADRVTFIEAATGRSSVEVLPVLR